MYQLTIILLLVASGLIGCVLVYIFGSGVRSPINKLVTPYIDFVIAVFVRILVTAAMLLVLAYFRVEFFGGFLFTLLCQAVSIIVDYCWGLVNSDV